MNDQNQLPTPEQEAELARQWQEQRQQMIDSGQYKVKEIDGVVTVSDPNSPINAELREWLEKRGIDPDFYIEEEAKHWVLQALKDPLFERAYIDDENGLVIEASPDGPDGPNNGPDLAQFY